MNQPKDKRQQQRNQSTSTDRDRMNPQEQEKNQRQRSTGDQPSKKQPLDKSQKLNDDGGDDETSS